MLSRFIPRATKVMAVMDFSNLHRHPNIAAKSPTITVIMIITRSAQMNVSQPPQKCTGGTIAKNSCNR